MISGSPPNPKERRNGVTTKCIPTIVRSFVAGLASQDGPVQNGIKCRSYRRLNTRRSFGCGQVSGGKNRYREFHMRLRVPPLARTAKLEVDWRLSARCRQFRLLVL